MFKRQLIIAILIVLFSGLSCMNTLYGQELIIVSPDGPETHDSLTKLDYLLFSPGVLELSFRDLGYQTYPLSSIRVIRFDSGIYTGTGPKGSVVSDLAVFPNPARDEITVIRPSSENNMLYIYGIDGTLIKTVCLDGDATSVPVSELIPGLYLVRVGNSICKLAKQ